MDADVELGATALVGFRAWKIKDHFLNPTFQSAETWHNTGNVKAECFRTYGWMYYPAPKKPEQPEQHTAPLDTCSCGIHAYYNPEPRTPRDGDCWGAIIAWGHIIECEYGFKAQYARPIALLEPSPEAETTTWIPESIATIAERYELPVLPLDELAQYALMFGEIRTQGGEIA